VFGHTAADNAIAASGIWVAAAAWGAVRGYCRLAQAHRNPLFLFVVALGPVAVTSAGLVAVVRLVRRVRSWRSGRRFSASAAEAAAAGPAETPDPAPPRAPVNIRASRLPHREPGLATTELDLARQLADVPLIAERPADPRPSWRKPVQILPAEVADSIHQNARRITVEANQQRLADLQKTQATWPSSQDARQETGS
jgi:hypothetical protein